MNVHRRAVAALAATLMVPVVLTGCAESRLAEEDAASGDGTTLEMWTRANSEDFDKRLVDAYNASHDDQVKLTVIPNDLFVTKFGSAAGSGDAPDLAAVDVIYMPNFNQTGQFQDLTERVDALPYKDELIAAHTETATWEGGVYGVPHNVDGSVLLYNKTLFEAAGLDPEVPPATFEEFYQAAKAITALGNDTYGYHFGGNCPGCNAYTLLPMIWGSGGDVLNEDGTEALVDSPQFREVIDVHSRMWNEGLISPSAQTEDGSTWQSTFLTGKIGMVGLGTFAIPALRDQDAFEWGLAALPTSTGDRSTFVGGDVIGIPAGSENTEAAWDFIEWTLEEEAQVEIMAKSGVLTARADLTDNEYTSGDPRVQFNNELLTSGRTPYVLPYNAIFNDANGPWLLALRKGIFEGDVDGAVTDAQEAFSKTLANG